MKKILIAYGDQRCAYSLKHIGKQANMLHLFDEVILYTPNDLPDYMKSSRLMQYAYGGGYWAWKPYIIKKTLETHDEGDIVCYVDAGCTLRKTVEWTLYFELMKEYDFLCFKYRDEYPEWVKFGSTSTKIKHWGKKKSLLYWDEITGGQAWRERNKIWGGFIFCKGKNNPVIADWMDVTLNRPEIILDPTAEELKDQYSYFALHKHDQVTLVALTYLHSDICLILPEVSETCGRDVAVYASRIRARNRKEYVSLKVKYWGRRILGDSIFEACKQFLIKIGLTK